LQRVQRPAAEAELGIVIILDDDAAAPLGPREKRRAPRLLQVSTTVAPDGMVKVSVSDSGVGLEDIDLERIFALFFSRPNLRVRALASPSADRSSSLMAAVSGRKRTPTAEPPSRLPCRFTQRHLRSEPAHDSLPGVRNSLLLNTAPPNAADRRWLDVHRHTAARRAVAITEP